MTLNSPLEHDEAQRWERMLHAQLGNMRRVVECANHEVMFHPHHLAVLAQGIEFILSDLEQETRGWMELPPRLARELADARMHIANAPEWCRHMGKLYQDARFLWGWWPPDMASSTEDLHTSLDAVLRLTRGHLEQTARLEKDYMPQAPPIPGGRLLLHHVLFRFVLNALRLMRPGNPQRHVLGVRTRRWEEQVLVTVSCTGPALPPEVLERLYDPLASVPLPGTGSWLDLSASQLLIEQSGGRLWVESQPGRGTAFCLLLPSGEWAREGGGSTVEPHRATLQLHGRNALRAMAACFARSIRGYLGPLSSSLEGARERMEALEQEVKHHPGLPPSLPETLRSLRELFDQCSLSMSRLAAVVRDLRLLDYAPPEAPVLLDVRASLNAVLGSMRGELEQTARLELDEAPRLPGVAGSEGHLQRVFRHLLLSAHHAMEMTPPRPHVLRVRTRWEDGRVRVDVSDTSRGFPPSELDSALEPFFIPYFTSGTGLGLSISEAIVQMMGGELRVESQEEHGTTYSVFLPARRIATG